jgi:hypothetical protein
MALSISIIVTETMTISRAITPIQLGCIMTEATKPIQSLYRQSSSDISLH